MNSQQIPTMSSSHSTHMGQRNRNSSFLTQSVNLNNSNTSSTTPINLSNSTSMQSSSSTTPVSLPAPAPVPGKSAVSSNKDSSKYSGHLSGNSKSTSNNSDQMLTLVAKLWFEHNLESSLSSLEKDEHEKRLKDLRKQIEYISETNWKYSSVDKYIGQS